MSYKTEEYLEGYENGLHDALTGTKGIERLSYWLGVLTGSLTALTIIILTNLLT